MVDYLAFAQSDGGSFPGSVLGRVRYEAIDNYTDGDNSVSQFVTLASSTRASAVQLQRYDPAFVKTELAQW